MSAQRIGYIRVSTADQSTARQLVGQALNLVFEDHASGKDRNRPQLKALFQHVRPGDTIVCHSIDRFARSIEDLRALVSNLTGRGIRIEFAKEGLLFSGERNHVSELMLNLLGSIAQFERALLLERQREGIVAAKTAGKYRGGTAKLSEAQQQELVRLSADGASKSAIARKFNISRETVYQYLRKTVASPHTKWVSLASSTPSSGQTPAPAQRGSPEARMVPCGTLTSRSAATSIAAGSSGAVRTLVPGS